MRLDFVAVPRTWLMPSRMVINTASVTGYNNQLKQATQGMKLGINNDVNKSTKKAGLHLMAGGPTKINPPNSHPCNPIHKAATKTATKTDPKPAAAPATQTSSAQTKESAPTEKTEEPKPTAGSGSESHDVNKIAVAVGAVAVAGLMFLSFR